jgi:hypothetical protein
MTRVVHAALAAIAASIAPHQQPVLEPYEVTVVARDFAFDAPDSVPEGATTFRFENIGKEPHLMELIRLESGHTKDEYLATVGHHQPMPAWATYVGGPSVPPLNGASFATLNLRPGHYLITCIIDSPDSVTHKPVNHMLLGMVRPLTVTSSSRAAPMPPADVMMTLVDYSFSVSRPLVAGTQTILVHNAAAQPHEVFIARLPPGKAPADLMAWVAGGEQGPPPMIPVGGMSPIKPDGEGEITVDLTPGEYGLWCFVSDAHDHAPHVAHGMLHEFTVAAPPSPSPAGSRAQ